MSMTLYLADEALVPENARRVFTRTIDNCNSAEALEYFFAEHVKTYRADFVTLTPEGSVVRVNLYRRG